MPRVPGRSASIAVLTLSATYRGRRSRVEVRRECAAAARGGPFAPRRCSAARGARAALAAIALALALDRPDADAAVVLLEPARRRAGNSASSWARLSTRCTSLPSNLGMALARVPGALIYDERVHRPLLIHSFEVVAMSYSAVARGLIPPAWTAAYKRLFGGRAPCPPCFSVLGVAP